MATEAACVKMSVLEPVSSTPWETFRVSVVTLTSLRMIQGMPWKAKAWSKESERVLFCGLLVCVGLLGEKWVTSNQDPVKFCTVTWGGVAILSQVCIDWGVGMWRL